MSLLRLLLSPFLSFYIISFLTYTRDLNTPHLKTEHSLLQFSVLKNPIISQEFPNSNAIIEYFNVRNTENVTTDQINFYVNHFQSLTKKKSADTLVCGEVYT